MRDEKREYALGGGPLHPDAARLAADISAMVADGELGDWSSPENIQRSRPPVDLSDGRFYGDDDWKETTRKKIKRHFAGDPRSPLAVTGAIASSDRLMKDAETMSVWSKIARQVVAVDMESAGIYKATQGRNVPSSRSAASAMWSASGARTTGRRTPARPPPRSHTRSCVRGRSCLRGRDAHPGSRSACESIMRGTRAAVHRARRSDHRRRSLRRVLREGSNFRIAARRLPILSSQVDGHPLDSTVDGIAQA
jgi:hypothetical protein